MFYSQKTTIIRRVTIKNRCPDRTRIKRVYFIQSRGPGWTHHWVVISITPHALDGDLELPRATESRALSSERYFKHAMCLGGFPVCFYRYILNYIRLLNFSEKFRSSVGASSVFQGCSFVDLNAVLHQFYLKVI